MREIGVNRRAKYVELTKLKGIHGLFRPCITTVEAIMIASVPTQAPLISFCY